MNLARPDVRELSVRQDPVAGGLAASCRPAVPGLPIQRPMIIMVHGYNVDVAEARGSYQYLSRRLAAVGLPQWMMDRIWHFYWPGNEKNPLLSALSFPGKIRIAVKSAAMLCDYLRSQTNPEEPLELVFIAHSLGCRLVAEALCGLLQSGKIVGPYVKMVALMAGAVPVRMIERGGKLSAGPPSAKSASALYSGNDKILRFFFPPGETAAGEGLWPQAVGLHGNPSQVWSGGRLDTGLNHGEYWGDARVAAFLMRNLGYATAYETDVRKLQKRDLPACPLIV
jgi:hypothetical protein